MFEQLDIHRLRTTPYHPSTDGESERTIQTVQHVLAHYVNDKQNDWDKFIYTTSFAINTATHNTTKATPFELVHGRRPRMPIDLIYSNVNVNLWLPHDSYALTIKRELNNVFELVQKNRNLRNVTK